MTQKKVTLGVIVTNRNFFADSLVVEGRQTILAVLEKLGIDVVAVSETDTPLGAVETWSDAQKCADLFKANRDKIDGILVTLPNFGNESGVADAIRLSRQHDIATHTPTSCPGVPSGLAWDTVKIDGRTRRFLTEPDRYVRLYRHNGHSCPEWEKSTRC